MVQFELSHVLQLLYGVNWVSTHYVYSDFCSTTT